VTGTAEHTVEFKLRKDSSWYRVVRRIYFTVGAIAISASIALALSGVFDWLTASLVATGSAAGCVLSVINFAAMSKGVVRLSNSGIEVRSKRGARTYQWLDVRRVRAERLADRGGWESFAGSILGNDTNEMFVTVDLQHGLRRTAHFSVTDPAAFVAAASGHLHPST
jgi:hypothetical protein